MVQAVGGGGGGAKGYKGMHVLTACKDKHSSVISWVVMLLLLLLTFPHFVHFIGIHDCQMAQRLITRIETIICCDVSQQTEGQKKQGANFSVPRHAAACFTRWCLTQGPG